eukprot:m.450846 g.450846  ORF g.450846 m.450846 type:complete len:766 (+) comp20055_c0_seq1:144-2441(+)
MRSTTAIAGFLALIGVASSAPATRDACSAVGDARVDCSGGYTSLNQSLCEGRGCCWDAGANVSCFYAAASKPIKTVHVISSNHFDAGYADITAGVVNMYFDTYFPRAAIVGHDFNNTMGLPLKWMTFSFLVSLFLDCPPNMGLHCPTETAVEQFKAAVKAQHIVWPALPTNAELATADEASLRFGIYMSNSTADTLGVTRPQVLSTRDVPGMPRSAIPILKRAGVRAVTEGMNGRMVPVNVPPIFRWHDPASDETILALWHWGGYGQQSEPGSFVQLPGSEHALAYNWRGDNAGPPMNQNEVIQDMAAIGKHFPGAQIVPSTFDEYVSAVLAEGADQLAPVVSTDLADTWAWGMASDPVKLMQMRAINRARTACEAANVPECTAADPRYYNLSRLTQKNYEHTWGVSVAHYGGEANKDWANDKFQAALASNNAAFNLMVSSWVEQRHWGVTYPLDNLRSDSSPHPLLPLIEAEFAAMVPSLQDPASLGFTKASAGASIPLASGRYGMITLDNSGAVTQLVPTGGGASIASSSNRLGVLQYQTLVLNDFVTWQNEYLRSGTGGQNEYGKPSSFMLAEPTPVHRLESPVATAVWQKGGTVLVDVRFSDETHTVAGAPEMARINYTSTAKGLEVELTLVNKTATRLPEAIYFGFNPVGSGSGTWEMDKLGTPVNPLDVADGASKGMHCITSGVQFKGSDGTVFFGSPDVALARWDDPLPFPTPIHRQPDLSKGVAWNLYNNIWNTNYPFWFPFVPEDATTKYRFTVEQ